MKQISQDHAQNVNLFIFLWGGHQWWVKKPRYNLFLISYIKESVAYRLSFKLYWSPHERKSYFYFLFGNFSGWLLLTPALLCQFKIYILEFFFTPEFSPLFFPGVWESVLDSNPVSLNSVLSAVCDVGLWFTTLKFIICLNGNKW